MTPLETLIVNALSGRSGEPRGTNELAAEFAVQKRCGCEGLPDDVSFAAVQAACKSLAQAGEITYRRDKWEYVPKSAAVVKQERMLFG